MFLIWCAHAAARTDATMQRFFVRLKWSLEALQAGKWPRLHWDNVKSRHPQAFFNLMGVSIDIDIAISIGMETDTNINRIASTAMNITHQTKTSTSRHKHRPA